MADQELTEGTEAGAAVPDEPPTASDDMAVEAADAGRDEDEVDAEGAEAAESGEQLPVPGEGPPTPATLVVAVAVGFALMDRAIEAQRSVFRGIGAMADGLKRSLLAIERRAGIEDRAAVPPGLQEMAEAGRASARQIARDVESITDRVVRGVIGFALDRVDIDEIVARVDMDKILARVDTVALANDVVDRMDLKAVAERVIDELDLVAIAGDVIDGMDLAAVAQRVMRELDLPEIIRESSGTVTVEAVDAIRLGGVNADRALSRAIDRLLRRKAGRDLHLNGDANGSANPEAAPDATVTAEVPAPVVAGSDIDPA